MFENGRPAGFGTDTLPGAQALFVPLLGLGKTVGVLGIAEREAGRSVLEVECPGGSILDDLDTAEDYRRLHGLPTSPETPLSAQTSPASPLSPPPGSGQA